MTFSSYSEPPSFVRTLTKGYAVLILLLVGLAPAFAIAYLYFFQDPALRFEDHGFHEVAIGISLLQSGFIAYVTYRCYLHSKELSLRWLTLGFLGFTVIYTKPQGQALTFDRSQTTRSGLDSNHRVRP